jgi:hypothetical protein
MKISDKGIEFLFHIAEIQTNFLHEQLEKIREFYLLRQFNLSKNREKNLFIAKLTLNDSKMDKSLGEKFGEKIINKVFKESKDMAILKF